jgi:tetratricopeptide (TPR) repeat protein
MGECHLALGDAQQAGQFFSQAVDLNPQFLKSYKNLADLLQSQGKIAEACQYLEQAQSISPLNTERLVRLGGLYLKAGEPEKAQQILKQTLKPDQKIPEELRSEAAELFLQVGMDEVAEDLFAKAIKKQPGNLSLYNRLGIALRRQKKHQQALNYYQQALKMAPKNEKIFYNVGILYFDLGETEKAQQAFQTALKLRPDFTEAREFLDCHFAPQGSAAP